MLRWQHDAAIPKPPQASRHVVTSKTNRNRALELPPTSTETDANQLRKGVQSQRAA